MITVPSICISVQGREVTDLTLTSDLLFPVQIYHFCLFCVANTSIFLNKNTCEFLIFVRIYRTEIFTIQRSHTCCQGLAPQRLPKQNSPCHRNSVLKVFYSSILNQDPVLQHKLVPREAGNLDQVCQGGGNQTGCQNKVHVHTHPSLFGQCDCKEQIMVHKNQWRWTYNSIKVKCTFFSSLRCWYTKHACPTLDFLIQC